MEAYDVYHPGTEPCSSRGFLSHKLRVELWVTEVLVSDTPHRGLGDMLFVKVHQSLQEVIHLHAHLCAEVYACMCVCVCVRACVCVCVFACMCIK